MLLLKQEEEGRSGNERLRLFLCLKFKDHVMGCYFESWILISLNSICFKLYMFNNIPLISQASPCKFGKGAGILELLCFWQILIEDTCSNLYNRHRTIIALPSWQHSLLGEERPYCCINEVQFILYVVLIYNIIPNFGNTFEVTMVLLHINLLFMFRTR